MDALKVADLMTRDVVACGPEDDLETLYGLMKLHNIRHVPVVVHGAELRGLVTHRDLLRASLIEQPDMATYMERALLERIRVREVMTEGIASVSSDADLRDAAELMYEHKFGCLPVVNGHRLVGMLTESDFVRFMAHGE